MKLNIDNKLKPVLDPTFIPAAIWKRAYRKRVADHAHAQAVTIALVRSDETCSVYRTQILPPGIDDGLTLHYLERILKFLLWQRGGCTVWLSGCDAITHQLAALYSPDGARAFDYDFFGTKVYGRPLSIQSCSPEAIPAEKEATLSLGRHLDGCRIGFDLGGSDRKSAAVIDGKVVFSEEIEWNPYFESDPAYHLAGINDSLKRAARHLPRVDAIGGSAAGVYVNNEVRAASLFRGVSPENFDRYVRGMFLELRKQWGNIPFDVVNDGEVTALAGAMSMNENAVLGIAMGTSEAAGYVTPEGRITQMLNELAFAPVDYRRDAPIDEWAGDAGCGVQYFSQQAVARLAPIAGFDFGATMPFPEQLIKVQEAMQKGDPRACQIYETIGTYLGYAVGDYADFYVIRRILLLGRVTSGEGGNIMIQKANAVLETDFPDLAGEIKIVTPDEKDKRHGQAVAAASLPTLGVTA